MRVSFSPDALAEAEAITQRYRDDGSPAAAFDFVRELQISVRLLAEHPLIGTPGIRQTRRIALKRFPYWLVYRPQGDDLRIIAIAHQRRRPGYWSKRH